MQGKRLAFERRTDLADDVHVERLRLLRVSAATSETVAGGSRQRNIREAVRRLARRQHNLRNELAEAALALLVRATDG